VAQQTRDDAGSGTCAADEAQAEQVRSRFIGSGPQYTPQPVSFYGN